MPLSSICFVVAPVRSNHSDLKTRLIRTADTPMHVLDDLPTGTVRCVFSSAPLVTMNSPRARGTTRPDGERVAVCEADATRPVHEVIEALVRSRAKAVLTV